MPSVLKLINLKLLAILVCCNAVSAGGDGHVTFSSQNGYSGGNLNAHSDWWAWDSQGGAYRHDVENAKVTWEGRNQIAVYQRPFDLGLWDREFSIDFRLGGIGEAQGPVFLTGLHFGVETNAQGGIVFQLWRPSGGANKSRYQLYAVLSEMAQGISGDYRTWGTPFDRSKIGDRGESGALSDRLRMTLFLSKSGANSWLMRGTLTNLDTGEQVSEIQFAGADLSEQYNTSDHFALFRSGTPAAFEVYGFEVKPLLEPKTAAKSGNTLTGGYQLWTGGVVPNHNDIPLAEGVEFSVVKPFQPHKDNLRWQHESSLTWHGDRLYASYGGHPWAENVPGSAAYYQYSDDAGKTWSAPAVIDSGSKDEPSGVVGGNLLSHNGSLWAFQYAYRDNHLTGGHMNIYSLSEDEGKWLKRGASDIPFWPYNNPVKMDNGNWIMGGLVAADGAPGAVAISHGEDFTRWDYVIIPKVSRSWMWGESGLIVDGPNVTSVIRYDQTSRVALVAHSKDYGRTWTRAEPTNMPMTGSKPAAGRLSTGQAYLIATSAGDSDRIKTPFADRSPLTIALSEPNETTFSKLYVIRHAQMPDSVGESHETASLSYPTAIERDGKLYVIYSNNGDRNSNFNSIELAVIPIESLQ